MAWDVLGVGDSIAPTQLVWTETDAALERVFTVWKYKDFPVGGGPAGGFEERSLDTGEVLHTWPLSGNLLSVGEFELSPDRSLLALSNYSSTLGGQVELVALRVADGVEQFAVPVPSNVGIGARGGLRFTAASDGVFQLADSSSGVQVWRYALDGVLDWTATLPTSNFQADVNQSVVLSGSGQLLVCALDGSWPGLASLRLWRLDPDSGAVLAAGKYDQDIAQQAEFDEEAVAVCELGNTGRVALLIEGFGSSNLGGGFIRPTLIAVINISALTTFGTFELASERPVGFELEPDAMTALPDGSGVVAAVAEPGPVGEGTVLTVARVRTAPIGLDWQRQISLPGAEAVRVALGAGGRMAVLAQEAQVLLNSRELSLSGFDVATGATLFDAPGVALSAAGPSSLAALREGALGVAPGRVVVASGAAPGAPVNNERLLGLGLAPLLDGGESVSVSAGGELPLVIDRGPAAAGRIYLCLGSRTGAMPGTPLEQTNVPLVLDGYTLSTFAGANGPVFQNTLGVLDAAGTASALLAVPSSLPSSLVGLTLYHASIDFAPPGAIDFSSQATSFMLVP